MFFSLSRLATRSQFARDMSRGTRRIVCLARAMTFPVSAPRANGWPRMTVFAARAAQGRNSPNLLHSFPINPSLRLQLTCPPRSFGSAARRVFKSPKRPKRRELLPIKRIMISMTSRVVEEDLSSNRARKVLRHRGCSRIWASSISDRAFSLFLRYSFHFICSFPCSKQALFHEISIRESCF